MSTITTDVEKAAGTIGRAVKYVYFFGEGHAEGHGKMKDELGGKGEHTIVLVHEMGGTLESWDGVAPLFAPSRRVLRYDFRG